MLQRLYGFQNLTEEAFNTFVQVSERQMLRHIQLERNIQTLEKTKQGLELCMDCMMEHNTSLQFMQRIYMDNRHLDQILNVRLPRKVNLQISYKYYSSNIIMMMAPVLGQKMQTCILSYNCFHVINFSSIIESRVPFVYM